MKTFGLDLRHSLRTIRKDPGYAVIVVLLLALGIGANSAIFSVAYSVLLRPLPYGDPERLVVALHDGNAPVSPADYLDYRKTVLSFEQMGAAQAWGGTLTGFDRPEQIPGLKVSANMLDLLRVQPLLGRPFRAEEEHAGHERVLLLSYSLWQDRFGGDKSIVGRQIALDRIPHTVIGVMPPSFRFAPFWITRAQMWTPLVLDDRLNDRGGRSLRVFGRLRGDATIQRAQAEMDAAARRLEELYPATNSKQKIVVVPLHEKVVGAVRPTVLVLLGTVGFVLLIACATVGNLMLARSVTRRKEMALRLAIGAQRSDLIRIALTESVLLAAGGGLAGVLLADWVVGLLQMMLPPGSIPRQSELGFDSVALLFAAALTIFSALLSGIIPAWQAMRAELNSDLKEGGRSNSSGVARLRTRSALISVEVAVSLTLMAGAGLMLGTMFALNAVDAGFDPDRVATLQIGIRGTDYDQPGRRANLFRDVAERLGSLPGVESVSAINHLPVGGDIWRLQYTVEGRPAPPPGEEASAVYRVVLPGYFKTMRIGLLQGRDFSPQDAGDSPAVAVINEAMARRQWPGENPIGKSIRYGLGASEREVTRTVVGVVRNARQSDWTSPASDEVYLPYYQRPDSMGLSYLTFVLRARGDEGSLANTAVGEIRAFQKTLPVSEVATMERVIADELWRQRLATVLIGAFAVLALLLSAAGIYGVVSNSIRQRTQEIGIRMALGASRGTLVGLVLSEGMRPVLIGMVAGWLCATSLSAFLQTLLYGVKPADTVTFAITSAVLLAVCMVANLLPAWRVTRIDPLIALRQD